MSHRVQVEAILFATDQPVPIARFEEVLRQVPRDEIKEVLKELQTEYEEENRAFHLINVAGGFQLTTKPQHSELVRRLFVGKRRVRLTRAALESLAIIAYKQPATRPEIDAIRGVSSGGVIETLIERELVKIAGRSEGIGRPLLYATSEHFLKYLGLNRIQDLPSLSELEALMKEKEAEERELEEQEMREFAQDETPIEEESQAPASATVDERLQEKNLLNLAELDEELQTRSSAIDEVSSKVRETLPEQSASPTESIEAEPGATTATLDEPEPETH